MSQRESSSIKRHASAFSNIKKNKINKNKNQKLERLQWFFFSFKLKRLTQNPKTELKRLWLGLNSRTK